MKITLLLVGKTNTDYIPKGISVYESRLKHYISFEIKIIPDIKSGKLKPDIQKEKEGEQILSKLSPQDDVILLDEKGKETTSLGFAKTIEAKMIHGGKNIVFIVGGAFGFSNAVYNRANGLISLSKMTFSHQMVRLFFVEQLYRAMTIIKGEAYHNK